MNDTRIRHGYSRLFAALTLSALGAGCGSSTDATVRPDVVTIDEPTPDVTATDVRATDVPTTDVPAADVAPSCTVGAACGNDCLPQDAPCWACGALTLDSQCRCRPSASACAPATGCDNPAPAGEGEFCGSYFWCNRACAAGLTCTGVVPSDGGVGGPDYRRRCERPRDAAVSMDPSFPTPAADAPARACGTRTCGVGQVCVLDCSGVDAGARDLHRCVDVPAACRDAATCPCRSVCFSNACTPTGGEVRCNGCA